MLTTNFELTPENINEFLTIACNLENSATDRAFAYLALAKANTWGDAATFYQKVVELIPLMEEKSRQEILERLPERYRPSKPSSMRLTLAAITARLATIGIPPQAFPAPPTKKKPLTSETELQEMRRPPTPTLGFENCNSPSFYPTDSRPATPINFTAIPPLKLQQETIFLKSLRSLIKENLLADAKTQVDIKLKTYVEDFRDSKSNEIKDNFFELIDKIKRLIQTLFIQNYFLEELTTEIFQPYSCAISVEYLCKQINVSNIDNSKLQAFLRILNAELQANGFNYEWKLQKQIIEGNLIDACVSLSINSSSPDIEELEKYIKTLNPCVKKIKDTEIIWILDIATLEKKFEEYPEKTLSLSRGR